MRNYFHPVFLQEYRNSQFGNTKSANSQALILMNHFTVLSCHIVTVYSVTKGMKCWHLTRMISATNEKNFWELSISNCFEIHLRLPHLTIIMRLTDSILHKFEFSNFVKTKSDAVSIRVHLTRKPAPLIIFISSRSMEN